MKATPCRIGITLNAQQAEPSFTVRSTYVEAILRAGALPILLPPVALSEADASVVLSTIDGLLLTGGGDIDPQHYGCAAHPSLGLALPARDSFETLLCTLARKMRVPTLGICRGIQVINVAFGGTLWRDLPGERPSCLDHRPKATRSEKSHAVKITAGSFLQTAFSKIISESPDELLQVNSIHHQAIRAIAPEFQASAVATDGLIEGIEATSGSFMVGVQWHPEELLDHASLFRHFIGAIPRNMRR